MPYKSKAQAKAVLANTKGKGKKYSHARKEAMKKLKKRGK